MSTTDPRNPAEQYANYIKREKGIRQFGAWQAEYFLWASNIVRIASETWKRDMPFVVWAKLWLDNAKDMELLDN
jgi:hypothetical protein